MKGVILAGGLGTRLYPLTRVTNKHLLPVYSKPMIYYPLKAMRDAGIEEVMIVVGGPFAGNFITVLGNGEEFGFKNLQYAYQREEGGIAEALSLAEDFSDGENLLVILGDNIFTRKLLSDIRIMSGREYIEYAAVFSKETNTPEKFGVLEYDEGNKPNKIIEKPKGVPPSKDAVTGIYVYPSNVFELIKTLDYSKRGELEITDLNNIYLKNNRLYVIPMHEEDFWSDCGSYDTLLSCSTEMKKRDWFGEF